MSEDARDEEWCRRLMRSLAPGGIWGVPRSGLIFGKTADDTLTLVERMPWTPEMPMSAEDLEEYQRDEIALFAERFALAGVKVVDTGL